MADINSTDELLVNRDDTTYTEQQGTIMANLQDDDYLLLNRDDTTYKITGKEFVESVVDPLVVSAVLDDPSVKNVGETLSTTVSYLGGKAPYVTEYQWYQEETDDSASYAIGYATASSYEIREEDVGFNIYCLVTVTDSLDTEATDETERAGPVIYAETVNKPTLITPADGAGINDQNRAAGEIFAESGAITSVEQEGFTATMSGLRFDSARETTLVRSNAENGSTNPSTISMWVKPTGSDNDYIYWCEFDAVFKVRITDDGGVVINDGSNDATSSDKLVKNTWNHIVISTNDPEAGLFINGVKQAAGALDLTTALITSAGTVYLGVDDDGRTECFDGYISDYYFVDGKALEPTAFGVNSGGTWGPIDSSVVIENIEASGESPYDQRPNMDQKWSDGATGAAGGLDVKNAFDGDLTTYINSVQNGSDVVYTFDALPFSTIRIYAVGDHTDSYVKFNGARGSDDVTTTKGWFDVDTSAIVGDLTTIEVFTKAANDYINLYAVEVDGRMLIDGPADNSQNWSQNATGYTEDQYYSAANQFKVNPGNGSVAAGPSSVATCVFPTPLTGVTKIEAQYASSNSNDTYIQVNSNRVTGDGDGEGTYTDVTSFAGSQTITSVGAESNSSSNSAQIWAWRVTTAEGTFQLIDAGAQWNTSQVWSETPAITGSFDPSFPFSLSFDGNTGIGGTPVQDTTVTVVWPGGLPSGTTRMNVFIEGGSITINDTQVLTGGNGWIDVDDNQINKVELVRVGNNFVQILAIEVDGQILVDQGSFGSNGFYLPFDPAATGKVWSDTPTGAFNESHPAPDAFDGDLSTYANSALPSGGLTEATFNFNPPIASGTLDCLSAIDLRYTASSSLRAGIKVNGVNRTQAVYGEDPASGGSITIPKNWFTLTSADGADISSVTIITANEGATYEGASIYAFKENGKLLVDHNNIGVDGSGNGNNFHDENFVVGNASQVWSSSTTSDTGTFASGTPANSFDGDHSTGCFAGSTDTDTSQYRVTFNPALTGSLKTVTYSGNAVTVNGVLLGENTVTADDTGVGTYDVVNMSELVISYGSAPSRPGIRWLELNGSELVDANIQDTVADTPMNNYGVLAGVPGDTVGTSIGTAINNGNLEISENGQGQYGFAKTPFGFTSGKYYAEMRVPPDLTSGGDRRAYFGINTNVDTAYPVVAGSIAQYHDGTLNYDGTDTIPGGTPWANGDIVGLAYDADTTVATWFLNGELTQTYTTGFSNVNPAKFNCSVFQCGPAVLNVGQQPFAGSNVTDNGNGTVTIDGEIYNTLKESPAAAVATLTVADSGTLDLIPDGAAPEMEATGNSATGTYVSHTATEVNLTNVKGAWSTESLTAKSKVGFSPAAIDPEDFTMTSSEFSATPDTVVHGSTIWQVADNAGFSSPAIDHTSETDLESYDASGLEYETIYFAHVKHISENGTESAWSDTNTFKTIKGEDPEPETTEMNGLRFDNTRRTSMGNGSAGGDDTYTASVWYKPTNLTDVHHVMAFADTYTSTSEPLMGTKDGQWNLFQGTHYSGGTPVINQWQHMCLVCDQGDGTLYIDNVAVVENISGMGSPGGARVGDNADPNGFYGAAGYMSDAYYVGGSALSPEIFGKEIDGRWAPLASSTVINNITKSESPYDQRPNMSQEWSAKSTVSNGIVSDTTNLFDGDLSTDISPPSPDETATFAFTDFPTGNWEVFVELTGESTITFNDGQVIQGANRKWVPLTTNSPTTASLYQKGANSSQLVAFKLNDQILVDGPADNSQNWSYYGSSNTSDGLGWDLTFNGSITGSGATSGDGNNIVWDISSLSLPSGDWEFVGTDDEIDSFIIDGTAGGSLSGASFANPVLSWTGALSIFELTSANQIVAIKYNGKILVDSGAQWNTSQVWSDTLNTDITDAVFTSGLGAAFDGSADTQIKSEAIGKYLQFDLNLTGVTSLQVVADMGNSANIYTNDDNGGENSVASELGKTPQDIPFATSGNVDYIKFWSAGDYVYLSQIIVNGQVLVDPGSFGSSGFYLPFDPEATGANYSGSFDSTGVNLYITSPDALFDGDTDTGVKYDGVGSLHSATMTLTTPITTSGEITVYYLGQGTARTIQFNNESPQTFVVGSGSDVRTATLTAPASITSITFTDADSQGGSLVVVQFEANNKILVDHNSIGVDASGNGNHFHDENFAAGNTSQVWSESVTSSTGDFDQTPSFIFDGNTTTGGNPSSGGGSSLTFTPVGGIPYTNQIEVYKGGSGTFSINDDEITGDLDTGAWNTLVGNASGTLNKLVVTGADWPDWRAIKIDGKLLIDANIQDTVADTPVTNYAVLKSGANGNLVSNNLAWSAIAPEMLVPADSKIYAEFVRLSGAGDIVFDQAQSVYISHTGVTAGLVLDPSDADLSFDAGDLMGIALDASSKTHGVFKNGSFLANVTDTATTYNLYAGSSAGSFANNFGQQPFAGSNVTDNGDGTVTLPPSFNASAQKWSDSVPTFFYQGDALLTFNGKLEDEGAAAWRSGGADSTPQAGTRLVMFQGLSIAADKLEVRVNTTNNAVWEVNNQVVTATNQPGSYEWVELTGWTSPIISVSCYDNSIDTAIAAVRIDGTILVDGDPTQDTSQVWSSSVSVDGTTLAGDTVTSVFNGQTSGGGLRTYNTADSTYTLTFDNPPTVTDKVTLYFWGETSSNGTAVINDGTDNVIVDFNGSKTDGTPFEATGVTQLKNIKFSSGDNGSPSVGVSALAVDGKMLVDASGFPGGTYNKLFQDFRETPAGDSFYDAVNERTISAIEIAEKYGLYRADSRLGIYDLTEQPGYLVAGYERRGTEYQPIRSLAPELSASRAETARAEAETVAVQAQADQYLNYLRAAACMWVVDKVYEAGEIVAFNGHLYRATINAVATAATDPGDETDRWEALGISLN